MKPVNILTPAQDRRDSQTHSIVHLPQLSTTPPKRLHSRKIRDHNQEPQGSGMSAQPTPTLHPTRKQKDQVPHTKRPSDLEICGPAPANKDPGTLSHINGPVHNIAQPYTSANSQQSSSSSPFVIMHSCQIQSDV